MSKVWHTVLILAVAVVIGVGSASAQDAPKKKDRGDRKRPSPEQIFKKLDANADGKITAEELAKSPRVDEARAKEMIERMDANKDGSVCAKEWADAWKKRAEGRKGGEGHKHGGKKSEK